MSYESAQPCGCDSAIDWVCERHAQQITAKAYSERVERMNMKEFVESLDPELPDISYNGAVTGNVGVQAAMAVEHEEEVVEGILTTEEWLRGEFPHGHKHYLPVALKQIELHSKKNHDYASGGDALGNFNRVAAILGNYPNLKLSDRRVVAIVYALKQIDAVLWGINSNITQKVEGLDSRLDDIAVYATIVQCMNSEAK